MSVDFNKLQEKLGTVLDEIKRGEKVLDPSFNTAMEFKHKIYRQIDKKYLQSEEYKSLSKEINDDFDKACEEDFKNYERTLEKFAN